jgi:two-component SAPR family response regulator
VGGTTSPPASADHDQEPADHDAEQHPIAPLAITASAYAVAHLLRQLGDRRNAAVRHMGVSDRVVAARGTEAQFWRALLLANRQESDVPPTPEVNQLPLGTAAGSLVSVAVHQGDVIGIRAENPDDLQSVVRHVEMMVDLQSTRVQPLSMVVEDSLREGQDIQIVQDRLGWQLLSTGERFSAFGVSDNEDRIIAQMLHRASLTESRPQTNLAVDWQVLVRIMGPVTIESREGRLITFEKSRSMELLAWLVTHRERPLRAAARTAMWDTNVTNATFNNVVSELRTELQKSMEGTSRMALAKNFDELLHLDHSIVCDSDVLQAALQAHLNDPDEGTAIQLAESLSLVRDMPFSGSHYLWPDPEGITSNIVHSIIRAAELVAEDALERGDLRQVFIATGQGLRVLRGHEGLIGIRMKAYAQNGDFAGVRQEWDRYSNAVFGWSGELDQESFRLMRLRDELLGVALGKGPQSAVFKQ